MDGMAPSRSRHALRGVVAASAATFVALFSHVAGGGAVPGFLGILAPLTLSTTVCVLLAGRRLSVVRLALSVSASQFLFHSLFVLGTPAVGGGAHSHHGHHAASLLGSSGTLVRPEGDAMWLAHLLAAIMTIALLHRGERVLIALLTLMRRFGVRVTRFAVAVVDAAPVRANVRVMPTHVHLPLGVHRSSLQHRGPPLLITA